MSIELRNLKVSDTEPISRDKAAELLDNFLAEGTGHLNQQTVQNLTNILKNIQPEDSIKDEDEVNYSALVQQKSAGESESEEESESESESESDDES
ncbi:hypothetical protein PCE1_000999 [Barthelona sp. PCE]